MKAAWNWLTARRGRRERRVALAENSPMRRIDPRVKLGLSLAVSLLVMLPLERLALFLGAYVLLLAWARLLPAAGRQAWQLRWLLLFLFGLDWWLIGPDLALLVSLRLLLLVGSFTFLLGTTSFDEFRLALEQIGLPYRLAFSLGLAVQSLSLLEEEWRAIREAQQARGMEFAPGGLRTVVSQLGSWVALTLPAVVLTTRRAWAMTESAYARGFDSPRRVPYRRLSMRRRDWLALGLALAILGVAAFM